jgi:hypothetical protein
MYSNLRQIYFLCLLVILGLTVIFKNKKGTEHFKLINVKSSHNDNVYQVRNDFNNTEDAANLMAQIRININLLVDYLNRNYNTHNGVKNLNDRLKFEKMREAKHQNDSTSYTINKGEEIHICLRDKNTKKDLHDINTMMFVVLHELAHIMSDSVGHNNEFRTNFKFLLEHASKINLYDPVNYQDSPIQYCGLKINNTPLKF